MAFELELALEGDLQAWERRNVQAVRRAMRDGLSSVGEFAKGKLRDEGVALGRVSFAWGYTLYPFGNRALADNPAIVIHPKGKAAERIFEAHSRGVLIRAKDALALWVPIPGSPADRPDPKGDETLVQHFFNRVGRENIEIIPATPSRPAMAVARDASISEKTGRVGRGGRERLKSGGFRKGTADVPLFYLLPEVSLSKSVNFAGAMSAIEDAFPRLMAEALASELARTDREAA